MQQQQQPANSSNAPASFPVSAASDEHMTLEKETAQLQLYFEQMQRRQEEMEQELKLMFSEFVTVDEFKQFSDCVQALAADSHCM